MNPKLELAGRRSDCPIAGALDVLGDRWSLLLVRDIGWFGRHRYKEFETAGEHVTSNILADRIKRLVEQGILYKEKYCDRPPRFEYHLTSAGRDLLPVLDALGAWSLQHLPGVVLPSSLKTRDEPR